MRRFARLGFAVDDDLLGLGGVGHHLEVVARFGQRFETQHFDRRRRLGFADLARRDRRAWRGPCRTPSRR